MTITAAEQYMIEVINRARLDPAGEAARLGIGLNDGLPTTTGFGAIKPVAMQVLAPLVDLDESTTSHSNWMVSTGNFSHTGAGGSDHTARISAAGYDFAGSWHLGENLATVPTSRGLTQALMDWHQDTLMNSPAHRSNMLDGSYREIGLAEVHNGNQSYVTENFGYQSSRIYVTGVAYTDSNHDNFYSVGEGRASLRFAISGGTATQTGDAGGYALEASQKAGVGVDIGSGASLSHVTLSLVPGNVKLDLVNGTMLLTSGSMSLGTGVSNASLLGIANLALSGNSAANHLIGNAGANQIFGKLGNDVIAGGAGNDLLCGDEGADWLNGGAGADNLGGLIGRDTLRGGTGNDRLSGGGDNDYLFGDGGNDVVNGCVGNDVVNGGSGNDTLNGSANNDTLIGGADADVFIFGNGSGADRILDFSAAQGDRLHLDNALWGGSALTGAQIINQYAHIVAGKVVFDFGDADSLSLTTVSSLSGLAAQIDVF